MGFERFSNPFADDRGLFYFIGDMGGEAYTLAGYFRYSSDINIVLPGNEPY